MSIHGECFSGLKNERKGNGGRSLGYKDWGDKPGKGRCFMRALNAHKIEWLMWWREWLVAGLTISCSVEKGLSGGTDDYRIGMEGKG